VGVAGGGGNYSILIYYNSGDKLWPITIMYNNRPDIVILDTTIEEAYSVDVAIPNSHSLHSTITEKLQKYTDMTKSLSEYGN
jgi:hypothetical protein